MTLPDEIDQHGVEIGEPSPGQAGAIEQSVDPTPDGVDGAGNGPGVPQVGVVVAGYVDGRFLEIDDVDFGAERSQLADHGRPHAGTATSTDDDPSPLVVDQCCHASLPVSIGCSSVTGEPQPVLGHDIPVDLGRAPGDRRSPRPLEALRPFAAESAGPSR